MRKRAAVVLSSVVFSLLSAGLLSCGSDSGSPTKPDPDPDPDPDPPLSHEWTPGLLGLPPADSAVLDSAAIRYRVLRSSVTAASARASLVAALNGGWDGVMAAGVTGDGTTIQIVFSDTVSALLVTDEMFQTVGGGQVGTFPPQTLASSGGGKGAVSVSGRGPATGAECADAIVPPNHRVHIVNPAAASVPASKDVSDRLRQEFMDMGWDEDDVLVLEPNGERDPSFTPETLFQGLSAHFPEADFGTVRIYAGTFAAMACAALGAESFAVDNSVFFATGRFDEGQLQQVNHELHHVPQSRWAQYEGWLKEGKMVHGKAWSESAQSFRDQLFIREDLLAEEIKLGGQATVHFIGQRGGLKSNLEGMVKTGGAASATGWDGPIDPEEAAAAVVQLTKNMVGRLDRPLPQSEALSLLHDQGMATYAHADGISTLVVETASEDPLYLPAQMNFDAPFDCLEAGTVYYDVDVTYPDCPELNQSFDFFPGGEHSLEGICPVGAEISYQAKDADGKVLGAGIFDLDLYGGGNDVDLCPCWGKVDMDFSGIPSVPGVDSGAELFGRLNYADSDIGSKTWTKPVAGLGGLAGLEGIPGQTSMSFVLKDGSGNVLGYSQPQELDLRCDTNATYDLCLGWIEFAPGRISEEMSSVVVSAVSDNPAYDPADLSFSAGTTANLVGLGVGDRITGVAEARNASGEVLDQIEFDQVITCGANQITLNFETYGLVLSTLKNRAPASGLAGSVVTAVARKWQSSDTTEPTGDPLPGVDVFLNTDIGRFQVTPTTHSSSVVKATDENGYVWVYLTSLEEGIATINAFVEDPALEAEPINVEFLRPIKMVIDDTTAPYDGYILPDSTQSIRQYCVMYEKWTDGVIDHEDHDLDPVAHAYVYPGHHVVGEEVRFVWIPGTSCPSQSYGYTDPYISGAVLHYYFGQGTEVTVRMIGTKDPLTQTVEFTTTLVDPSAPPPSPFDLTALERYLFSEFREQRE